MFKPLIARALALPGVNRVARAGASLFLPEHKLYRLPVSAKKAVFQLRSGDTVTLLCPLKDQVAKDIVWGEGKPTSPADARVLRLVEEWSHTSSTFLDIGTYSGLFAMVAAKANPALQVVAFEIAPENYLITAENLIENDLVRVDLRLLGLSDESGKIVMPRNYGAASHPSSLSLGSRYGKGVTVPVATLDSLGLLGPMTMKLDVEGFEWNVLIGGRMTIESHKPNIVCEILPRQNNYREIEGLLKPLGYRFFVSLVEGFEERERLVPDRAGRDWIFTTFRPPEHMCV